MPIIYVIAGLKLLDHYFAYPDVLELFDNSKTMLLVAEYRKGQPVMQVENLPSWIVDYLGKHLSGTGKLEVSRKAFKDIEAVRESYQKLKNRETGGQNYKE